MLFGKRTLFLILILFPILCLSNGTVQGSSNSIIDKTSYVKSIIDENTIEVYPIYGKGFKEPIEKIILADIEILDNTAAMEYLKKSLSMFYCFDLNLFRQVSKAFNLAITWRGIFFLESNRGLENFLSRQPSGFLFLYPT